MPLINANQVVSNDPWLLIRGENAVEQLETAIASEQPLLVEWALWLDNKSELITRAADVAVVIDGATDWDVFSEELSHFKLVAIDFPSFADGRGFSQARMLRRDGFKGEIRAVGDVTWDRLRYMKRCGFDTYAIADDRFDDAIFSAFTEINVCLQGSADDPRPIYRQ